MINDFLGQEEKAKFSKMKGALEAVSGLLLPNSTIGVDFQVTKDFVVACQAAIKAIKEARKHAAIDVADRDGKQAAATKEASLKRKADRAAELRKKATKEHAIIHTKKSENEAKRQQAIQEDQVPSPRVSSADAREKVRVSAAVKKQTQQDVDAHRAASALSQKRWSPLGQDGSEGTEASDTATGQ